LTNIQFILEYENGISKDNMGNNERSRHSAEFKIVIMYERLKY